MNRIKNKEKLYMTTESNFKIDPEYCSIIYDLDNLGKYIYIIYNGEKFKINKDKLFSILVKNEIIKGEN